MSEEVTHKGKEKVNDVMKKLQWRLCPNDKCHLTTQTGMKSSTEWQIADQLMWNGLAADRARGG